MRILLFSYPKRDRCSVRALFFKSATWDEQKHPRSEDGRFCSNGAKIAEMDNRDEITKKYFNGMVSDDRGGVEFSVRGAMLDEADICGLTGAPDGSHISISLFDEGVSMVVNNQNVFQHPAEINLVRMDEAGGQVMILDALIMLRSRVLPSGFGLRMFAIQAHTAGRIGVSAIALEAAGSSTSSVFNGYYTWPRYGFDAKIDDSLRSILPGNLADAVSIADLMDSQEGRLWWKANGRERYMEFDLTPGSRSWQTLLKVMQEKGVRL